MLSYCLKYKNNTKSKNPWVKKTSNREITLLSKCAVRNSTKSKIIKKQEALGLLNQLGIKTPLTKINTPLTKIKFCIENMENECNS